MATEAEIFFNFMFALLTYVFVYPPQEFVAIGLSVEQLATKFHILPAQQLSFVEYHMRRTTITVLLHACLPAVYVTLYNNQFAGDQHFTYGRAALLAQLWTTVEYGTWLLVVATIALTTFWIRHARHPLISELRKYANVPDNGTVDRNDQTWVSVASSIDDEYRRMEKTVSRVNTITTVLATENWVIKTLPYWVHIAHQSDTALIVVKVTYAANNVQLVSIADTQPCNLCRVTPT